ncbi:MULTISPECIES: EF-hand domain-containing protein [Pseudoalteromonas]|uniref:EF-hand domain-containing protein n=1 Tax=Pseudoalteromonas TaxID=53246 RepID=UPI000782A270|nr:MULTISPECIES: EF-hand domain-containing protein [Gammaproteobacteria]MCF7502123.1 EF-hand domain-containing protein [Pseudoalteromonas sp. L1]RZF94996.1 calmodulin [Pseudoalteromonas sp. CO302Y]RZG11586.1 calmodulin [Pseudoalteromonas sp. CO133X]UJX25603.1 EF-hand domain-containing protein [Pseudoalteromonas sp. CF6-2]WOC26333.1 EF-hand domain-containing protein [Pseudoalteromonas sp. N1230-9]
MKQINTTLAILALATSSAAFAQGVSFSTFDTNSDGVISKEEASANVQLEKLFPELDTDGNGELSKEEFAQIQ